MRHTRGPVGMRGSGIRVLVCIRVDGIDMKIERMIIAHSLLMQFLGDLTLCEFVGAMAGMLYSVLAERA